MNQTLFPAGIFLIGIVAFVMVDDVYSQGTTVQLPVTHSFGVNTAVMVPDGGTMSLGGISGGNWSASRRSVPIIGGLPLVGRGFGNRSIGSSLFSNQSNVHVQIIDMHEIEKDVIAEGERRKEARSLADPNGSPTVRNRAQFMSKNIGKSNRVQK